MGRHHALLVGGEWVGNGWGVVEVINPFDGSLVGVVPETPLSAMDAVIGAASEGARRMRELPAHKRSEILEGVSRLIQRDREEIAEIIAREAGKSWKYALAEADRSSETFRFAALEARNPHGELIPMDASPVSAGRFGYYLREPIGIIGAITPFNFPMNLVAHKVAPAIAAGNAVILKPATKTPLASIKLAHLLEEAGLPAGGINLVVGPGSTVGNRLVEDDRLAMITFTGSPAVGRALKARAGLKRVTLELGSNSPTIIDEDADLDRAIPRCLVGSFANSGQVCISVQRIYVHERRYDEFIDRFVQGARGLSVGNPLDRDNDVGPMIGREELERVLAWLEAARHAGARIECGGKVRFGTCLEPTVVTQVTKDMEIVCAEVFAPIVSVIPFATFDEALAMADDSIYGLQAGIYTSDISKAFRAIGSLNVGGVIINDVPTFRVDHMPYGGNKLSGLGREGVKYAIEEMTNIKTVCFNI
ncbi:MAG: aldehyde dehydrogenase family protein [Desulfuromonadia bacterium]